MSEYKKYVHRSIGVTEIKKSEDKKLAKSAEKEKEEHPQLSKKDALLIAKQHEKSKVSEGTAMNSPLLSPTAIATPVIGVSVRGSSTGGLPSGADQMGNITPSRLGGYEKIDVNRINSKLVDNTPNNPDINQHSTPIINNPALQGGVTHTHQVQRNAGEAPQSVTGASTDSDNSLTLKSAMPKSINVDVEEGSDVDNNANNPEFQQKDREQFRKDRSTSPEGDEVRKHLGMNETFARHKKLMQEKLKEMDECDCGPDCNCDDEHKVAENVGANEPIVNKFKMDKEKAGMVKLSEAFERMKGLAGLNSITEEKCSGKADCMCPQCKEPDYDDYKKKHGEFTGISKSELDKDDKIVFKKAKANEMYSQPFERMRGLANLGDRKVMSNGLWGNTITEINHTKDAQGNYVMAVGAPGSEVRNAIEKGAKCKSCGKTFTPNYGEYNRCSSCLASQHEAGEKATGVQESEKWMQDVSKDVEKKGTQGALHKDMGVPADKKIPTERLKSVKATLTKKENKTDTELKLLRRIVAALNMRGEK